VLDVGSGAGDVTLLIAGLVGESGEVIGVDKAAAAVAASRARAQEQGLRHVSFRVGDPTHMRFDRPFDAVIGRYVLLYQADPVEMVRGLLQHLRPGGLVLFHEPDWQCARSIPSGSTYDSCCRWIQQTFARVGTDSNMAGRLYRTLVGAGLSVPAMRMQTFIAGGVQCAAYLQAVADLVGSMLPSMVEHGVAPAEEIDHPTLAERMQRETIDGECLIVGRSEIGAWARLPGGWEPRSGLPPG
jgi:predicted O-methyltransferase YrrM